MPPKKEIPTGGDHALKDLDTQTTKILAGIFFTSDGNGKFSWEQLAETTGIKESYLKKLWPEVKRKAIEVNPGFATAAAAMSGGATTKSTPKAKAGKKRKPSADKNEEDNEKSDSDAAHVNKKLKSTRGRSVKKAKLAKQAEDGDVEEEHEGMDEV